MTGFCPDENIQKTSKYSNLHLWKALETVYKKEQLTAAIIKIMAK
jgi:hypothetical protein